MQGPITGGVEHPLLAAIARLDQEISYGSEGWSEEYLAQAREGGRRMAEAYDILCRVRAEDDRARMEETSRQEAVEAEERRRKGSTSWSTRY